VGAAWGVRGVGGVEAWAVGSVGSVGECAAAVARLPWRRAAAVARALGSRHAEPVRRRDPFAPRRALSAPLRRCALRRCVAGTARVAVEGAGALHRTCFTTDAQSRGKGNKTVKRPYFNAGVFKCGKLFKCGKHAIPVPPKRGTEATPGWRLARLVRRLVR